VSFDAFLVSGDDAYGGRCARYRDAPSNDAQGTSDEMFLMVTEKRCDGAGKGDHNSRRRSFTDHRQLSEDYRGKCRSVVGTWPKEVTNRPQANHEA
jgi:hypothetical protein